MLKRSFISNGMLMIASAAMLFSASSCKREKSSTTGWNYNDSKWGGFEVRGYDGQETGPGLTLVEGGSYLMGNTEQNLTYDYDNIPKKITVSSFYMDESEVANVHYREYLYWLNRTFGSDFPEVVKRALPDSLVWRD
ncbi:MAG TPA: SUMF1/EgtB/PvdO family nonheme iron enzyme, partial [Chitinophagales bacterium]|nr:SUMF1/EgtB/PvdO family nonheme iron enzyme [Chitinophagales bacterium]